MNTKDIDNAINHIISLQEKLSTSENNLQYIKRLQALKYWLCGSVRPVLVPGDIGI
jgi:hypothetical protein